MARFCLVCANNGRSDNLVIHTRNDCEAGEKCSRIFQSRNANMVKFARRALCVCVFCATINSMIKLNYGHRTYNGAQAQRLSQYTHFQFIFRDIPTSINQFQNKKPFYFDLFFLLRFALWSVSLRSWSNQVPAYSGKCWTCNTNHNVIDFLYLVEWRAMENWNNKRLTSKVLWYFLFRIAGADCV